MLLSIVAFIQIGSCSMLKLREALDGGSAASWTYDEGGIVRGDRNAKQLALIFTGGEYGEGAHHILDVLDRHGAKASFFLTGQYLSTAAYREGFRRMIDEGHYVGPHSHGHLLYCDWQDRRRSLVIEEEFKADLSRNLEELRRFGALAGKGPVFFIPPYEYYNADQVRWAADLSVVLFNFTPGTGSHRDWIPEVERGFLPSADLVRDILAFERNDPDGLCGALLLLHLGSRRQDKMHLQLEPLLAELQRRGYTFVRIDGLLSENCQPPRHPRNHAARSARPLAARSRVSGVRGYRLRD